MENRKVSDIVGGVVVFFILLFVYTKFIGPIPFSVNNINTNKTSPFEVSGTGKAAAAPDTALINLGATQISSSVLDAQNKTNLSAQKIIDGLLNLDIPKKNIKTTNYSINPDYSYTGGSAKITGYSVTQNLEVKVPIEKTNQAVDVSIINGANLVGNISFSLNDDKQAELTTTARKEAVGKAKKKAEGLSKASGIKLGKIINVVESEGQIPRPIFLEGDKAQGSTSSEPSNITPGETSVEITITLTYETF